LRVLHTTIKQVEDVKITLIKYLGLLHELPKSEKKHETLKKKVFFGNLNQLEMVTIIIDYFHIEIEVAKT
jgi:hypothetical protein